MTVVELLFKHKKLRFSFKFMGGGGEPSNTFVIPHWGDRDVRITGTPWPANLV